MTTPQTFYAVLGEDGAWWAGPYENANKADHIAKSEAQRWGKVYRVIAYTVIATFGGDDD